jgi:endonuclease/exonuclease/phosphatase family metal-dependent hydrolase
MSKTFGNGFIALAAYKSMATTVLAPHGTGEKRGLVHLELPHPMLGSESSLQLFLTHLDHTKEHCRVKQLKDALDFINLNCIAEGSTVEDDHLMMGDFNAACEDDYTTAYLERINEKRNEFGWGPLAFDTCALMKERGYVDIFKTLHPDLRDKELVTSPKSGLRIDYFWASPGLAKRIDWEKTKCTIDDQVLWTDHYPLHLDIKFKEENL